MNSIILDDGLKTYEIKNADGTVRGIIGFNPSDMNFMPRAVKTKEKIEELLVDLRNVSTDITREEEIAYIEKLDKDIKAEIDKLFDTENASYVVFGNQNCLNTLKGYTFVERFLTAIMPILKEEFEKEHKASAERINKYTAQVK